MDAFSHPINFSSLESSSSFPYGIIGYGTKNITNNLVYTKNIQLVVLFTGVGIDYSPHIYVISKGNSYMVGAYNNSGTTCRITGSISGTTLYVSKTQTVGDPNIKAWFVIGG